MNFSFSFHSFLPKIILALVQQNIAGLIAHEKSNKPSNNM